MKNKTFYVTIDFIKYYKIKAQTLGEAEYIYTIKYGLKDGEKPFSFASEIGMNPLGLYVNRYYARKNAASDEVTVKVDGGYKNMSYEEYRIWRKQK